MINIIQHKRLARVNIGSAKSRTIIWRCLNFFQVQRHFFLAFATHHGTEKSFDFGVRTQNKAGNSLFKSSLLLLLVLLSVAGRRPVMAENFVNSDTRSLSELSLDNPLTLDQAVNLVLERNPDLHIANQRIARTEALVGESLAAFYPQVKARLSYQYSDDPSRVFGMIVSQRRFTQLDFININNPGSATDFRPEVAGTLSLFNGGKDYHRSKVAMLGMEVSELEHVAIRNNLIQGVTDSYYALLVAQENQLIATRSIDAVSRELKHTQIRYQGGSALKSDVLSLQVQLANAREAQIRTQNAIEMSRTVLRTLLDLSPSSPVATVELKNPELPKQDDTFAEILTRAEASRPELQIASRRVEIQQRKVKIAQGEYLPRVDAFVNYGMNSKDVEFSSSRENVTAGVALEMDLFSGFGTQERVRKAESELAEARQQEHKLRLQIRQEVKNALLMLNEALQRRKVTEIAVAASEEALRLVTEQHQAGAVTVTRFIEAQVARDQANARTIAALYDTLRANAVLKRAAGGWQ